MCELAETNKTLLVNSPNDLLSLGKQKEVDNNITISDNDSVNPSDNGNEESGNRSKGTGIRKRKITSTARGSEHAALVLSSSDSDSDLVYDSDTDPEYFPGETNSDRFRKGMLSFLKRKRQVNQTELIRPFRPPIRSETLKIDGGRPSTSTNAVGLDTNNISLEDSVLTETHQINHARPSTSTDAIGLEVTNLNLVNCGPTNQNCEEITNPPAKKSRRGESRWKKSYPDEWKINVNKSNRQKGLPYKSKTGKMMPAKVPKPIDCSSCFFQCSKNFNEEVRNKICSEFILSSFDQQKNFILSLVEKSEVQRKRKRNNASNKPEKSFSFSYYFFNEGTKVRVCKNFFLRTLAISNSPLKTAFQSISAVSNQFVGSDKRGHKEPPNKTSEEWIKKIEAHIESFPVAESHFCRKDTKKKYLDETLSINKMYELFREKYKGEDKLPKDNVYRKIFCTKYNLSFFHCSKDRCLICMNYENANDEERKSLQVSYNKHIARKEAANESKAKDKERASIDPTFISASFDLQKVLQIPVSNAGPVYYSRKLCVYNLTVYEAAPPNKAYCFCWNENNGKRGSCEIGTCLLEWFKTLPVEVKEVSLFSDTCGGQNRNQYVAALFLYISQTFHLEVIEHKFLEKGHSKMEADSMHSAIEYAQKNVSVMCMRDWLTIFSMARSDRKTSKARKPAKGGYLTKEFKFDEFFDLKDLSASLIENRTTDSTGKTVKWLQIKRLRYEKAQPGVILFSYDCKGSDYKHLKVTKLDCSPGRPKKVQPILKQLYHTELGITEAKKKDLLKLCKTNVFPKEQHDWVRKLKISREKTEKTPEPTVFEYFDEEED